MNQEILTSTQLYPVSLASSEKILEILTDDQMLDIENEVSLLQQPFIRNFLIIAYIIVFLFCIVGNIIILLVIITKKSMRTVTNFLLANLAVADLLVGLFCICQTGFHFLYVDYSQWLFGKPMCHVYLYLINMMPTISSGILVLLSIERFIAVVRPMLVQDIMTGRVLIISTLLIWTISIITNLPYLLAVQYISHEDPINGVDMAICTRKFIKFYDYDVLKFVSIMNLIVWYFVPVILLLVIYISIGCVLANARKKHPYPSSSSRGKFEDKKQGMLHVDSHSSRSNLSNMSTNAGLQENITVSQSLISIKPLSKIKNKKSNVNTEPVDTRKRVIKLVAILVISFASLHLPRYIYLMFSAFKPTNSPRCLDCIVTLLHPITFLLMFINSAINPILYAFLSQRFRNAISDTLKCSPEREKAKQKLLSNLQFTRNNTMDNLGGSQNLLHLHTNARYVNPRSSCIESRDNSGSIACSTYNDIANLKVPDLSKMPLVMKESNNFKRSNP